MATVPSPDHTDAYFLFGGALLAFLGQEWRFRRQNNAERERLDRQLVEERERLNRQLEQDRELVDLSELRGLLDQATTTSWEIMDKLTDAAWVAADAWADDSNPVTAAQEQQKLSDAKAAAYRLIWPVENLLARIAIRLGRDNAVTGALAAFRQAAHDDIKALPLSKLASGDAVRQLRMRHSAAIKETRGAFVDRVQERAGYAPWR